MKIYCTLFLLLCLNTVWAQTKTYQFKYINSDDIKVGILTVSNKAFRFDSFQSIMKIGKGTTFQFSQPAGGCLAVKSKFDEYLGSNILRYVPDSGNRYTAPFIIGQCDTIYFNTNSIINAVKCKKIAINYKCESVINNKTRETLPAGNVKTVIWVCTDIKTQTPFTFNSKNTSGLILRFERRELNNYSYITTDPDYVPDVRRFPFHLPAGCKILKNKKIYQESSVNATPDQDF